MELAVSYWWRLAGEALAICYRASPGYEARLTPHSSLIVSGEPIADLNYAVIDQGPQAEAQLRDYVHLIQARGLAIIVFLTADIAGHLASTARALGLQDAGPVPLMVYQPAAAPTGASALKVERVTGESALRASNATAASAFGIPVDAVNRVWAPAVLDGPGVDIFLAWHGSTPLSTVWTTRAGATVGIWAMGTAAEHQRKGAGRAVLQHAIRYHSERGATTFYLLATAAGKPLYERVGFRTFTEGTIWVAGASTQLAGH